MNTVGKYIAIAAILVHVLFGCTWTCACAHQPTCDHKAIAEPAESSSHDHESCCCPKEVVHAIQHSPQSIVTLNCGCDEPAHHDACKLVLDVQFLKSNETSLGAVEIAGNSARLRPNQQWLVEVWKPHVYADALSLCALHCSWQI